MRTYNQCGSAVARTACREGTPFGQQITPGGNDVVALQSEQTGDGSVSVAIAVLTYRRSSALNRILPQLMAQAESICPPARVLLIDNDPDAGARATAQSWRARGLEYFHEPVPGIAAGRNRALDEARDCDALVFIDDDELPTEGWLRSLMRLWQDTGADAVAGPVRRVFEGEVDPWVLATGVFDRRSRATGTEVGGAATSNLLIDVAKLRDRRLRFDHRFGITGGSDTRITHDLVGQGGRILWCDEAEVLDPVPPARTTRRWVLLRTFRTGNVWSRVGIDLAAGGWGRLRSRAGYLALGLRLVLHGAAQVMWGTIRRDEAERAKGTTRVMSGAGVGCGAVGYVYTEYRRGTGA